MTILYNISCYILTLLLLLLINNRVDSLISISYGPLNTTIEYPVYNALLWRPQINYTSQHSIPVVNLHQSISIFNYCDLNSYTKEGILPLLIASNVNPNDTWFGMIQEIKLLDDCVDTMSVFYNYIAFDLYNFLMSYLKPTGMSLFIDLSVLSTESLDQIAISRSYDLVSSYTGKLSSGLYIDFDMIRIATSDDPLGIALSSSTV